MEHPMIRIVFSASADGNDWTWDLADDRAALYAFAGRMFDDIGIDHEEPTRACVRIVYLTNGPTMAHLIVEIPLEFRAAAIAYAATSPAIRGRVVSDNPFSVADRDSL